MTAIGAAVAPSSIADVTVALAALSRRSEALSERSNTALLSLARSQRSARSAQALATDAKQKSVQARFALAGSLSAQYRSASFSRTVALLSSQSGQSYLDTVQSLNLIAAHRGEVVNAAAQATQSAELASRAAVTAVQVAAAKKAELARQQAALSLQVGKYRALLSRLTAAEQARFFAARAASVVQIEQIAVKPVPAKSKGASAAIAAAEAQLGKPYVYGGSGPGSFDCSGLTAWAWGAAGVSLPHSAEAQYGYGTHVSIDQLQPGDLVFFYSPIGHVGIYIGNGLMIHAPTTGDVVKISPVQGNGGYVGATRVG